MDCIFTDWTLKPNNVKVKKTQNKLERKEKKERNVYFTTAKYC